MGEQRRLGRNQTTCRMKRMKEINIAVLERFYCTEPFDENGVVRRGYRQRICRELRESGMFNTSEQTM